MNIVAYYSFNNGLQFIENNFTIAFNEVKSVINSIDAYICKNKISNEQTMVGKILFNPGCLNNQFEEKFHQLGWYKHKEECDYTYGTYLTGYIKPKNTSHIKPYREMDFVKPGIKLGVEVQFGKYAFMAYNVCAKMTIFHNFGIINAGIEIVPTKHFADEMSTGVSYFEQISWDLEKRGSGNIDIPVLILGIDA